MFKLLICFILAASINCFSNVTPNIHSSIGYCGSIVYSIIYYFALYYMIMLPIKIFRQQSTKCKNILIVLGSGGHTGEMLILINKLNFKKFNKITFVYSIGDISSRKKVFEKFNIPLTDSNIIEFNNTTIEFKEVFRSRQVGQSFKSSIFTTIKAMIHSVFIVLQSRPNMIISNGPGVALPLIWIGYVFNKLLILTQFKILFIESFCRYKHLSLSGKLIKPISDKFIVLWDNLTKGKCEYMGKIL